jgi:helix-turn-helix protein
MTSPVRRLWQLIEPYHALTYFAPEAHEALEDIGLRGFWRGYFASRAAPLGPVDAAPVTAMFFGFHPEFVGRAVPSVWSMVSPQAALDARLEGIDRAVRGIFGEDIHSAAFSEAAELASRAAQSCSPAGRPLFAANATLPWPDEAHLALWHAATLLREHRGDGHVAALCAAGVGPCEAHVTQVAASGASPDTIKPYRGWSDDDWTMAIEQLRKGGWIDGEGTLTAAGWDRRQEIEGVTDHLAAEPLDRLGPERAGLLLEFLAPVTATIVETGLVPYPNPIGVPAPD